MNSAEFPESEGEAGGFEEGWSGKAEDAGVEESHEEAVGWGVYRYVMLTCHFEGRGINHGSRWSIIAPNAMGGHA